MVLMSLLYAENSTTLLRVSYICPRHRRQKEAGRDLHEDVIVDQQSTSDIQNETGLGYAHSIRIGSYIMVWNTCHTYNPRRHIFNRNKASLRWILNR